MKTEKLNLAKILRGCEGVKLWSPICGEVTLKEVLNERHKHPIRCENLEYGKLSLTIDGRYLADFEDAECILYPSRECRDWSQFQRPIKLEVGKEYETRDGRRAKILFRNEVTEANRFLGVFKGDHGFISEWWQENGRVYSETKIKRDIVKDVTQ